MNSTDNTTLKLLPKSKTPEPDRDEAPGEISRAVRLFNLLLAVVTAALLAVLILPRTPRLESGDTAIRDITAPFALSVDVPGPDQTVASFKVGKGELIVESGHRVSEKAALVLAAIARREVIAERVSASAGLFMLVLVLLYLFYRDVLRYRPALVRERRKMILLAFLLVFTVVMAQSAKIIYSLLAAKLHLDVITIGFALPVAAGSMLAGLLLDFHLALVFSFIVSFLMGVAFQSYPYLPVYYFLGGITAALSVIRCKKRSALLRAGALTAMVNLIAVIGVDLYRGELWTRGGYDLLAGLFGAITVSVIVSASLPFFEALFDIATNIKLLELLDPNHPLLKALVYKSPGTYHHSIVIGNLAEAAAEAIGENALLARVGAYYHDIGKAQKPEYFIENQRPSQNKHDTLTPSMSSLIIASHVKDGVEAARAHKLPSAVVDIIHQHHGNSLITYFYRKAKELQPFDMISEEDYRYHAPRPRTKVAAIVMLSDAVEAASRTLENPTPQRIQALTSSVITRIFLDDQLSMCDLTLNNLREISKSFNLILNGIFHHRIDYPGMDLPGGKKRSEHQDKKQSEDKKTGNGRSKEAAQGTVAERRSA